jgi:DNA-directed RNA polymerase specialized sigma24 family protein
LAIDALDLSNEQRAVIDPIVRAAKAGVEREIAGSHSMQKNGELTDAEQAKVNAILLKAVQQIEGQQDEKGNWIIPSKLTAKQRQRLNKSLTPGTVDTHEQETPADTVARAEDIRNFRDAIIILMNRAGMSEAQEDILMRHYGLGGPDDFAKGPSDIARELGVSKVRVQKQIETAMLRIRRAMADMTRGTPEEFEAVKKIQKILYPGRDMVTAADIERRMQETREYLGQVWEAIKRHHTKMIIEAMKSGELDGMLLEYLEYYE